MTANQQGNKQPVYHGGLANKVAADFRAKGFDPAGGFLHGGGGSVGLIGKRRI